MRSTLAQLDQIVELAKKIQQVPAPTFSEASRAKLMQQLFLDENLADVEIDTTGNVYARLPVISEIRKSTILPSSPLVLSAHLDTVFPVETNLKATILPDRVSAPGIGDNSMGLAGLISLITMLRARNTNLTGDLWLVANTCEEGLGNLAGMTAVVERFKAQPQAYVVLEGMGLGEIFHRGLAVKRYRVTVKTAGGHSWIDYGHPSAIHEITRLINAFLNLTLPTNPRTTLNVGTISGGTSINTIAAQASLELDLRSEEFSCLQDLACQVEDMVIEANRNGVEVIAELIGQRPAGNIPANHWLVSLAEKCLLNQGVIPVPGIGSTDANLPLSRGLPAICIGLTTGGGAHTMGEFANIPPLAQGMEYLYEIVTHAWTAPHDDPDHLVA